MQQAMSQPVISEDVRATNRPETWVNLDLTTGLFLMLITSGILVLVWWLVT